TTPGCKAISTACWCPFPQCDPSTTCACGGGSFIRCASTAMTTCAAEVARVAALCPGLNATSLEAQCASPSPACATECLAQVSACGDISCSLCGVCDCIGDAYFRCYRQCAATTSGDAGR